MRLHLSRPGCLSKLVMNEIHRICKQMDQAFQGGAWHGPSLLEVLNGVDATVAAAKPLPEAHSIWEIVLHLTATQKLLLRRIHHDPTELTPDEDWPPVPDPTEQAWRATVDMLKHGEEKLRQAISRFPDDRLDEPLIEGGSSAYNNFHGHVQHNLYHAAQIGLIRKLGSRPTT